MIAAKECRHDSSAHDRIHRSSGRHERRRVLVGVERSAAEVASSHAVGQIRRGCPLVEVLEQELRRLSEVGVGELVVGCRRRCQAAWGRGEPGDGETRSSGGEYEVASVYVAR